MKRNLLLAALLFSGMAFAQETHHVSWGIDANTEQFSKTIAQGDTVMWMWTTAHPHTVTSEEGSAETFDSGMIQGVGLTYSKTFNVLGNNPYVCLFHSGMTGVITVNASAGTSANALKKFNVWPNPVNDVLNVSAAAAIEKIEMFDTEGRKIMDTSNAGNSLATIHMENFAQGTYLLKVTAGGKQNTMSVVKK